MPTSPNQLLRQVGCAITGSVRWETKPESREQGVYIVSLHADPDKKAGLPEASISEATVAAWIERVESLTLDGGRPEPIALMQRLARYWLPDEAIVYIGKATLLRKRLGQYYSTPLGDRGPHAGGHWIKTLTNLTSLTVHYAELDNVADPEAVEKQMLRIFSQAVSRQTRAAHPQQNLTIPFANLEIKGDGRRKHRIRNAVLRE
jgi:hypothetical protein